MTTGVLATMFTTTSYGSWLSGDARGYVQDGRILPGSEQLAKHARGLMKGSVVRFSMHERNLLFETLVSAADEFGYRLTDVATESWHLHWIIYHGEDEVHVMVGRLKNRMRQVLNRGRIWTSGYWYDFLLTPSALENRQAYIARHEGCRLSNGRFV